MRSLVIASSLATPLAFLAYLALATRIAAMSCDYPQGPVLLAITVATSTLLAMTGAFGFARYQHLRLASAPTERLLSLASATTAPVLLLACLALFVSALAGATCG